MLAASFQERKALGKFTWHACFEQATWCEEPQLCRLNTRLCWMHVALQLVGLLRGRDVAVGVPDMLLFFISALELAQGETLEEAPAIDALDRLIKAR